MAQKGDSEGAKNEVSPCDGERGERTIWRRSTAHSFWAKLKGPCLHHASKRGREDGTSCRRDKEGAQARDEVALPLISLTAQQKPRTPRGMPTQNGIPRRSGVERVTALLASPSESEWNHDRRPWHGMRLFRNIAVRRRWRRGENVVNFHLIRESI